MNAVIVCDYADVNGGAAKVAIESARGLAEAGHWVVFVFAVGPVSAALSHPRISLRQINVPDVWKRANRLAAAVQSVWNVKARHALEGILGDLSPSQTVVHFHQWTKALSPAVLLAPRKRGFVAIATLHDYFIGCPNGAYYLYPKARPCTLRPLSVACVLTACDRISYGHKAVRIVRQLATHWALLRSGESLAFLNVSAASARIVERLSKGQRPRYVVRSPVSVAKEPPVAVADNSEFVFVGRLTEEKGIRALAALARKAGIPLTIIGDGPLLAELKTLGGTVKCTGWLDGEKLTAALRNARALVFPSRWYETTGLVVLEVLARGVPAVVSGRTAAVDFVDHGENGLIFDPDDEAQLLECLCVLGADSTAARMGREAYRRYWAAPLLRSAHTRMLETVYREILGATE